MAQASLSGTQGNEQTQRTQSARRVTVPPRQTRRQDRSERLIGIALVSPLVLIMVLVIAYPLVNTVWLSLQNQAVIATPSSFVGFDTYQDVFVDGAMWQALGKSGIWLVGNLVVQTVLAFATALLLTRAGRWSRSARTWVLLPWVIPTVAVAVIWQWMTNSNYGIITKLFGLVGLENVQFFADDTWALPMLIVMNSWHWFPLGAVIIYGALQTVPVDVYEAARVDGASSWKTFWHITVPLLQPVLFALGLVGSLWSFNIIDSIYLVTRGGPAGASTTAPVLIYDTAFKAFHASDAAAMSVATVVLLGILTWIYIRLAKPEEA